MPFCNSSVMPGVSWAQCSNSLCVAFHIQSSDFRGWNTRVAPAEDVRAVVDEPVANCFERRNGSGEWVNDSGSWEDGMPSAEILRECEKYPHLYRVRFAYAHPQRQIDLQCSEVSPQCSEHLRTQGRLLPPQTLLPHPPRHWGFLQPQREVPGYTIEQMKEYGALCAAEALRQNK